ncbi:DsbA family protein [Providencia sp. PROV188]|uniref:DsbA family protein n=1 Tax=unclassified Providencia TaxID=2633465 RepID=UPI0012B53EA9|nr:MULTISPECIES: DsbA family protein [unclassified Providencia]MTB47399.1 DsbA family protein [Providencia sp. wls1950]MTC24994.1 DsbA family protein [Providencia sp. wls1938]MTC79441.1 DsbA family protein [Providencia sp. wls1916]WBM61586.1 DsbA family protein [Providencia sp. PROV188]
MNTITLHYIYDPYCGWCYAAAPLIAIAANHPNIHLELHGGGMLAGSARLHLDDQFRQYILQSDKRIAAMTGQVFGDDYIAMLHQPNVVMDSAPPQTAILAATKQGKGVEMLKALQKAHYVSGRQIKQPEVLAEVAQEIGLNIDQFQKDYAQCAQTETDAHIAQSKQLLGQSGASGFPTLLIEQQGKWLRVPLQNYLGEPEKWQQFLDSLVKAAN